MCVARRFRTGSGTGLRRDGKRLRVRAELIRLSFFASASMPVKIRLGRNRRTATGRMWKFSDFGSGPSFRPYEFISMHSREPRRSDSLGHRQRHARVRRDRALSDRRNRRARRIHDNRVPRAQSRESIRISGFAIDEELRFRARLAAEQSFGGMRKRPDWMRKADCALRRIAVVGHVEHLARPSAPRCLRVRPSRR